MLDSIPSLNPHLFTHSQTYSKSVFHCTTIIPSYSPYTCSLYVNVSSNLPWQLNCTTHLCYRKYAKGVGDRTRTIGDD